MTPMSGLSGCDIVEFGSGVIGLAEKSADVCFRLWLSVAWPPCDCKTYKCYYRMELFYVEDMKI